MGPVKMGHFELWELRSWPQFVFCLFRPCPTMPLSRSLIEPQPHNWMCSGKKTKSIWKFGLDCDDLVSVTQKMAWSLGRIILHTPHSNHPFLKPFFSLRESINRVKKSYNRRAPPPFYWKCPIFSFLFITPLSKIHLNFCQGDIVWISENNNPWTAHTRITLLNNLHLVLSFGYHFSFKNLLSKQTKLSSMSSKTSRRFHDLSRISHLPFLGILFVSHCHKNVL